MNFKKSSSLLGFISVIKGVGSVSILSLMLQHQIQFTVLTLTLMVQYKVVLSPFLISNGLQPINPLHASDRGNQAAPTSVYDPTPPSYPLPCLASSEIIHKV